MPYKDKAKNQAAKNKWSKQNPDYYREWRKNNADKKKLYAKRWREKNRDKVRAYGAVANYRKYGLTVEEAEKIKSDGCEACGTKEGKLCIDHDHETDIVRGCLCQSCNIVLGYIEPMPSRALKVLAYLEAHNELKESRT